MKEYVFYRVLDEYSKEPLGKGKFINVDEAVLFFSAKKQISVSNFKSLFKVEQK
jgi:hypothetical protein